MTPASSPVTPSVTQKRSRAAAAVARGGAPGGLAEEVTRWEDLDISRHNILYCTLWVFNIAMENGPFIDGLPIKNGDFPWLC